MKILKYSTKFLLATLVGSFIGTGLFVSSNKAIDYYVKNLSTVEIKAKY